VLDVPALQDDGVAHLGGADLQYFAWSAGAESGFPAEHGGAVAEHRHADEGVAVAVPAYDGDVCGCVFFYVCVCGGGRG